jgi:glycosyltransferase involved in cell wall biosynthesis
MIHLWSHDIGAVSGGIQSYTLAIVRALESLLGPAAIKISLKHERTRSLQLSSAIAMRSYGWVPKRLRTAAFAVGAIAWGFQDRPGLILSCHPNFAQIGPALGRAIRSQFWTAAHGIDAWEECPRRVVAALASCDRILAVSQFTKRKLIECHSLDPSRISVLANTFDGRRFFPNPDPSDVWEELGLIRGSPLLLSVGRLAEPGRMKGFDQVIRAMPQILKQAPGASYVIAGAGPDLPRLRQIAAECRVAERVKFAGFVPDDRLPSYYNACDAFVLPSKREGFGIVFLEALACGSPAIAGNVDASGEALLGGELGILVNPDEVGEIAGACISLLTRSHERRELFDRAGLSQRVTEAYGPEAFTKSLRELLATYTHLFADVGQAPVRNR